MHGDDDESVPTTDARLLADAHGAAELSLLAGAGHRLRHDPRAVAILLGWLDRVPLSTRRRRRGSASDSVRGARATAATDTARSSRAAAGRWRAW